MTTLSEVTDFILETGQPLMYFNKGFKEYKFQQVVHGNNYIIFPYKNETHGDVFKIKIPKSLKGDIKKYNLDRQKIMSKISVTHSNI